MGQDLCVTAPDRQKDGISDLNEFQNCIEAQNNLPKDDVKLY